jgi:hypothetical protein
MDFKTDLDDIWSLITSDNTGAYKLPDRFMSLFAYEQLSNFLKNYGVIGKMIIAKFTDDKLISILLDYKKNKMMGNYEVSESYSPSAHIEQYIDDVQELDDPRYGLYEAIKILREVR